MIVQKSNKREAARQRFFFALWPSPEAAGALHSWASSARALTGGRVTRVGTIHLTLAFIGPVAVERLAALVECGSHVDASAFDLRLEECRWWKHNGIVWAGPRPLPPPLADLARQLDTRLGAAGFPTEQRVYKAHVTLVRKAALAPGATLPALDPVQWRCREFVLVRSVLSASGPDYEVLERFELS